MFTHTLLLMAAMATTASPPPPFTMHPAPVGGPPSIRIAGKSGGGIDRADWVAAKTITLAGCVPDAKVVSYTVRFTPPKGQEQVLMGKTDVLSDAVKQAVSALPVGSSFTVHVEVLDSRKKAWEVPVARYTLGG